MYFGEALRFSLQALQANKFRTFLTALGLVIGNASVILVVTISITSRDYILDQIRGSWLQPHLRAIFGRNQHLHAGGCGFHQAGRRAGGAQAVRQSHRGRHRSDDQLRPPAD